MIWYLFKGRVHHVGLQWNPFLLRRCPYFSDSLVHFSMYTKCTQVGQYIDSVLKKRGVIISQILNREVPLYIHVFKEIKHLINSYDLEHLYIVGMLAT